MPTPTQLANAIRALSMDAVQNANSGHPGAPMGMADIAQVLWCNWLNHNPNNPNWVNRDRFVLSNGHGSMLLYALLHLSGYDLTIEDLRQFRQLHSKTPGHPEYGYTDGVETTTGPLGQGIANAVGMALGEKILAAQFNRDGFKLIDHFTYVFLGDGCMMEGISHEACSLAGTLGLGKLIAFYDDNGISIDGEVEGWFTDDTVARFTAYGWQVIPNVNGHDPDEINLALKTAHATPDVPTLICCKTIIGFGSPNKEGKEDCHGAPLGDAEIELTRAQLKWVYPAFEIPADVYAGFDARSKGAAKEAAWQEQFSAYRQQHPDLAAELERRLNGALPEQWQTTIDAYIATCAQSETAIATRKASQNCLDVMGAALPELLGGSADLAGSNLTLHKNARAVSAFDASGNYIHYGVREFAMAAMMNGLALYRGFIPYGATFLMFSEYARNAIRMAALMRLRVIYIFTHDSIGLGEDGPTHQPVEQIASLRLVPNLDNWRPCDSVETAVAYKMALAAEGTPSTIICSRQNLPPQARDAAQIANIERGAYVLSQTKQDATPDVILLATGSEVALAQQVADALLPSALNVRVVSMPCCEVFDRQDAAYRQQVLPDGVRMRVSIEAGVTAYWAKYTGLDGVNIGIDTFGESAPAADLYAHFGLTVDKIVSQIQAALPK